MTLPKKSEVNLTWGKLSHWGILEKCASEYLVVVIKIMYTNFYTVVNNQHNIIHIDKYICFDMINVL